MAGLLTEDSQGRLLCSGDVLQEGQCVHGFSVAFLEVVCGLSEGSKTWSLKKPVGGLALGV